MRDYRNRMIRAWVSGATYQYDHSVERMRQVFGSTTTDYPNRFYSVSTSTQSGTGTSTAHIWHGRHFGGHDRAAAREWRRKWNAHHVLRATARHRRPRRKESDALP
jgi:hypothetical protein